MYPISDAFKDTYKLEAMCKVLIAAPGHHSEGWGGRAMDWKGWNVTGFLKTVVRICKVPISQAQCHSGPKRHQLSDASLAPAVAEDREGLRRQPDPIIQSRSSLIPHRKLPFRYTVIGHHSRFW